MASIYILRLPYCLRHVYCPSSSIWPCHISARDISFWFQISPVSLIRCTSSPRNFSLFTSRIVYHHWPGTSGALHHTFHGIFVFLQHLCCCCCCCSLPGILFLLFPPPYTHFSWLGLGHTVTPQTRLNPALWDFHRMLHIVLITAFTTYYLDNI